MQRVDIQALRGLAILLVLLYHSGLFTFLKAGYLGVDIFFVVSGYLITGIVMRGVQAGRFSFREFYVRRAKRLLPAAYATFVATTIGAALFLTQSELRDYSWQLLGAVTFTGNIALWMQTGYFEGAAALKPLLHVWSLAIEEQYYLLLPAIMVFVPARYWRPGVLVVLVLSLVACLILVSMRPGATFYLLPTRAWELAIGSCGPLLLEGSKAARHLSRLFWPSLISLLLVPWLSFGPAHPGVDAVIVCTATLIVILRQHSLLNSNVVSKSFGWLGDISYSLYLVHWPLFAIAANLWVSPLSAQLRASLLVGSILLATAMYYLIEQPARKAAIVVNRRLILATVAVSSVLICSGFVANHFRVAGAPIDFAHARRGNLGLGLQCEFPGAFTALSACATSASPKILVWGDSYAMHLVEGMVASTDLGVMQATKTTCGPLLGVSSFRASGYYNRNYARDCINFNESVLKYLETSSIEVVVFASLYGQYLAGNRVLHKAAGDADASTATFEEVQGGDELAATALGETISKVRAMGKRVVLVAPPPSSASVDLGRCMEFKMIGRPILGADFPDCSISEAAFHARAAPVASLLTRVSRTMDVPVFTLAEYLCKAGRCSVELDGIALYRDTGHLSYDGSRLLGEKLGLAGRLVALAR